MARAQDALTAEPGFRHDKLRQRRFQGLREEKDPEDAVKGEAQL
jgi:hypothetical protein